MGIDLQETRSFYPRVSDIIGKQTFSSMMQIPIDKLVKKSIIGQKVHSLCTAYAKGLCIGNIDPEIEPYVEAFMKWCDKNVARCLMSLIRLYDDVKRFSGEPDMIVDLKNGKRALIDIKTNAAVSNTWDIQLSAYDRLCRGNGWEYDEVFILHLKQKPKKKNGEDAENLLREVVASIHMPDNLNASWDIFSSALTCYDYFYRKEPKGKKDES